MGQCATGPSPPTVPLACGKQSLAQGRCQGKTLAVPVHAPLCTGSLLICKVHAIGLASFWGSSLSSGTGMMDQPEQGRALSAAAPAWVSCWKTPGAAGSGGSVGGTLHPRGASPSLPKGEPCPCRPSNLPHWPSPSGAAHGVEPRSPLKASPPFTAPGDILWELSLGPEFECPSSPGRRTRPSLVPPPRQHTAELGLGAGSHPECPERRGLWRVSSQRSSQAGLCQDAAIWEELP